MNDGVVIGRSGAWLRLVVGRLTFGSRVLPVTALAPWDSILTGH